ncbi:MAG: hypothetical protein L6Q75_20325 [Burkholderiaceae bacterium]|nr:hypothetical protein [Burkholderiaceae bacterium]
MNALTNRADAISTAETEAPRTAEVTTFEAFRWMDPPEPHEELPAALLIECAGKVRDLAGGLGVVLAMLERDEIDRDSGDADGRTLSPLFNPSDRGNLLRLCVAVCSELASTSDKAMHRAEEVRQFRGTTGGGAR